MEAIYIKKYINDKKILNKIKEKTTNIINNSNSNKHVVANKVKLKLISEWHLFLTNIFIYMIITKESRILWKIMKIKII